jgi:hypothetical protein
MTTLHRSTILTEERRSKDRSEAHLHPERNHSDDNLNFGFSALDFHETQVHQLN